MKYDWIKSVPDFIHCFSEDHRLIIDLIGVDNYFKLYSVFGKTGIYFSNLSLNSDQKAIIGTIGYDNYSKLFDTFGKTGIYFSSSSITALKKAWAIKNRHIDYNEAARTLEVSTKTIYNWRHECYGENFNLFDEEKK